jgi:diphthine synthase
MKQLGEIVFVGLGLNDEMGISLQGMEETKNADCVFMELYTSLMPGFSLSNLERMSGKDVTMLSRKNIEEENAEKIMAAAKKGKAVFLVPGDPMIATTHISVRLEAEKKGIGTRIVHGASVLSAVIGLSGLHNYKFGKSVTIPFPEDTPAETPYQTIAQNRRLGAHTLCLLDIKVEERRYLTIPQALEALMDTETRMKQAIIKTDTLAVGVARAGSKTPIVKADAAKRFLTYDFGGPPYTLVFPGKLHFMEAESLIRFAGAPEKLREEAE